jgi:hypothetical protein
VGIRFGKALALKLKKKQAPKRFENQEQIVVLMRRSFGNAWRSG